MMDDYAVVGGGVGGTAISVGLSKKYSLTLYEKEPILGGCSSTFKHKGNYYNSGATTFAGYKPGGALFDFFEENHIDFLKKRLDASSTVIMNDKTITRYEEFDKFIDSLNKHFYHKKNHAFYTLILDINKKFYALNSYYYTEKNFLQKIISLSSFSPFLQEFKSYLFTNALKFIENFYGGISDEYKDYLDNQILIVAQSKSENVSFFTAALALGYNFTPNYYVYGGLGSLFESMSPKVEKINYNSQIQKIEKEKNYYTLHTANNSYKAKNVILNTTIFDSAKLFDDEKIVNYFDKYKKLDSGVGAFMLYITLKEPKNMNHHYQIILDNKLPYTISNSIFVSFGDFDDDRLKRNITISVHSNVQEWKQLSEMKRLVLEKKILKILNEKLDILSSDIQSVFSATPLTYERFVGRTTLGGIPITQKNQIYKIPSNITPINGLYLIGDTTFASQGWIGVMMGVRNLQRYLCKT